jgi:hypothetical protein
MKPTSGDHERTPLCPEQDAPFLLPVIYSNYLLVVPGGNGGIIPGLPRKVPSTFISLPGPFGTLDQIFRGKPERRSPMRPRHKHSAVSPTTVPTAFDGKVASLIIEDISALPCGTRVMCFRRQCAEAPEAAASPPTRHTLKAAPAWPAFHLHRYKAQGSPSFQSYSTLFPADRPNARSCSNSCLPLHGIGCCYEAIKSLRSLWCENRGALEPNATGGAVGRAVFYRGCYRVPELHVR